MSDSKKVIISTSAVTVWVVSAVAEQLRILKEQYFYAWVVGRKGCPICRQQSSQCVHDCNAGQNIGTAYEYKTLTHRFLCHPTCDKVRVSNLEPMV